MRPLALSAAALLACGTPPPITPSPPIAPSPTRTPSPYEARVHDAVRVFRLTTGLVHTEPDRSPFDCRAPTMEVVPLRSEPGAGESQHGHKLYFLFAKDVAAYREMTGLYRPFLEPEPPPRLAQPLDQLIVKEAWTDVPIARDAEVPERTDLPSFAHTTTWIDGERHALGERAALFAMMKVGEPGTPDTDEGWVYATFTPDGAEVTSSGLLPSCMRCHTKAPRDRLFGPKR